MSLMVDFCTSRLLSCDAWPGLCADQEIGNTTPIAALNVSEGMVQGIVQRSEAIPRYGGHPPPVSVQVRILRVVVEVFRADSGVGLCIWKIL